MRDDLQELVDRVSRLLGAPATLEDAEFTLLAFCAHSVGDGDAPDGGMDAVRTRSILTRGSPPATRRWFEEFGIASAEGPLRTPGRSRRRDPHPTGDPGPPRRPHPRVPVAARRGPHRSRRPRRRGAVRRGRARRRGRPAARRAERGRDGARPLSCGPGSPVHPPPGSAPRGPSARGSGPTAAQVLVALAPAGGAAGRLAAAGGRRGHRRPRRRRRRRRTVAVLVPLPHDRATCARPPRSPRRPSAACPRAAPPGCPRCGAGVDDLAVQWREARAAARIAAAVPRYSPVAHWAGAGRVAAGQRADRPGPRRPPAARRARCSPRPRRSSWTARAARRGRRPPCRSTARRCTTG